MDVRGGLGLHTLNRADVLHLSVNIHSHETPRIPFCRHHHSSLAKITAILRTTEDIKHAVDHLEARTGTHAVSSASYASLLKACGVMKALKQGACLHEHIAAQGLDRDTFIGNHLIEMYAKCETVHIARSVFDDLNHKNVYSWTIMIAAYANLGYDSDVVVHLFYQMRKEGVEPNNVTFVSVLGSFHDSKSLVEGRLVHGEIVQMGSESDVCVGSALVNMYGKCGSSEEACRVFQRLPESNRVTWNAVIDAFARSGHYYDVFDIFQAMQLEDVKPDMVTFVNAISSCSSLDSLETGRMLHCASIDRGCEANVVVGTAILNMYGKSSVLHDAEIAFQRMHFRNLVTWNSMIAIYTLHGQGLHALEIFNSLQEEDLIPDHASFVNALSACGKFSSLSHGRLIHGQLVAYGFVPDTGLETALINMYGKSGVLMEAEYVFNATKSKDMVTWNAMLAVYTQYGLFYEGFQLFFEMQGANIEPSEVTFLSILTLCSRAGLIEEGFRYFCEMRNEHSLLPSMEHFGCMVDLLGRAGLLNEAEELIEKISESANLTVWETLLAACQVHGDRQRAENLAKHVVELYPENSAAYILLSNIYATERVCNSGMS